MALIAFLLLILQIIFATAVPIDEGSNVGTINIKDGRKIVVNPGRFPYVVHLHIVMDIRKPNQRKISEINAFCGGTLVTRKVVLSAAHCVDVPKTTLRITAWLGVVEINLQQGEGQQIPVRGFTIHHDYTSSVKILKNFNDIALLWLAFPAMLNGMTVRLAKLPTEDFDAVGRKGYIVGWGRRYDGERPTMLQEALVRAVSSSKCQKFYNHRVIPSTFICIMSDDRKKISTVGDSGGPFVVDDTIIGVTSFGSTDRERSNKQKGIVVIDPKTPAVYTYVPKYVDWISKCLTKGPEAFIRLPPIVKPPPVPPRKKSKL